MKSCVGCVYAKWRTTESGRLSPTGDGICTWEYKKPKLPASMYMFGGNSVNGGHINRREELRDHCVFYKHKEPSE